MDNEAKKDLTDADAQSPSSGKLTKSGSIEQPTKPMSDADLFDYFANLAPPEEQTIKARINKLLPALAVARRNGSSPQVLAVALKEVGLPISHVTLRKRLDKHDRVQKDKGRSSSADDNNDGAEPALV